MDPLNWKRALLLAIAGVAVGLGAAISVEATDAHPLVAPLLAAVGSAVVAYLLRGCELLNCLVESAIFTYCTFIGMGIVRTGHNFLERAVPHTIATPSGLLHGMNIVTLAVGLPYTFAVVLIIGLPVWSLAQISKHRLMERDERFWDFMDEQSRR